MATKQFTRHIAITGGAGFIGSNLLPILIAKYPDYLFVNVDSLTYAGNLANLNAIESSPNYKFDHVDIADGKEIAHCFSEHQIDGVIHLAAESHVDRSILGAEQFIRTNVLGTFNLLDEARKRTATDSPVRFLHVSTDEVLGPTAPGEHFAEDRPLLPSSPYAASKAAGDHLARVYATTFGLDVVISRCSNNFGPYQFPEKVIPLMIDHIRKGQALPVYGDGLQERDWLHVEDHTRALDLLFHLGRKGETYHVSSHFRIDNLKLIKRLCQLVDQKLGNSNSARLVAHVSDRPGHDRAYALDSSKLRAELGWKPEIAFERGLESTVEWYLNHLDWLDQCTSGEYLTYYDRVYANR